MISIGEKPDLAFQIKYAQGGEVKEGSFSDLLNGSTIVSVFMRANTGSCDKQMISLAAHWKEITKSGWGLIGVSRDTAPALNRYSAKHGIDFPLVSDPDFQFAEAVDSMVDKKMYGKTFRGPTRSAYFLDSKGKLVELIESVDAPNHGSEALEVIGRL